jgi:hypothetical protein
MKDLGYDRPLYILLFDHRDSFQTKLFGWTGRLTEDQTAQIAASKQVIYDGFKAALRDKVLEYRAGILVDEQFGAAILKDASTHAFATACPAEKSGQVEFDFVRVGGSDSFEIGKFMPLRSPRDARLEGAFHGVAGQVVRSAPAASPREDLRFFEPQSRQRLKIFPLQFHALFKCAIRRRFLRRPCAPLPPRPSRS